MKIEFEDAIGNYGSVDNDSRKYNWTYEGDFNDVYAALVTPEGRVGHGKSNDSPIEKNTDIVTEFTPKEKVRKAFQNLHEEPLVHVILRDGEQIV